MSENTPEATEEEGVLFDAPKDAPEESATGYAVYDRTLGQYVGPKATDKSKAKPHGDRIKGHRYTTVRV